MHIASKLKLEFDPQALIFDARYREKELADVMTKTEFEEVLKKINTELAVKLHKNAEEIKKWFKIVGIGAIVVVGLLLLPVLLHKSGKQTKLLVDYQDDVKDYLYKLNKKKYLKRKIEWKLVKEKKRAKGKDAVNPEAQLHIELIYETETSRKANRRSSMIAEPLTSLDGAGKVRGKDVALDPDTEASTDGKGKKLHPQAKTAATRAGKKKAAAASNGAAPAEPEASTSAAPMKSKEPGDEEKRPSGHRSGKSSHHRHHKSRHRSEGEDGERKHHHHHHRRHHRSKRDDEGADAEDGVGKGKVAAGAAAAGAAVSAGASKDEEVEEAEEVEEVEEDGDVSSSSPSPPAPPAPAASAPAPAAPKPSTP